MEIQGKIIKIEETQQVSESFKKRNFVLEYAENPMYPEFVLFEAIMEKCTLLDDFSEGQYVKVQFNLKGRKWISPQGETRYFTSLQAWRLDILDNNSKDEKISNKGKDSSKNNFEDEVPW